MPDFLFLMHANAVEAIDPDAWGPYLRRLRETGRFQGGSAVGDGGAFRRTGLAPAPATAPIGFLRLGADSLDQARTFLADNPVYAAGGTVEIRELPRTDTAPSVPNGTELARAFLPTRDFAVSKAFYEALGFTRLLDADVAIFAAGAGGFILQRRYQADWAENGMMQLMVDKLDAWWAHIAALDLPARFGVRPPIPPAVQPWGLRVAYLFDPAGVLWHIAQRRPGAPAD